MGIKLRPLNSFVLTAVPGLQQAAFQPWLHSGCRVQAGKCRVPCPACPCLPHGKTGLGLSPTTPKHSPQQFHPGVSSSQGSAQLQLELLWLCLTHSPIPEGFPGACPTAALWGGAGDRLGSIPHSLVWPQGLRQETGMSWSQGGGCGTGAGAGGAGDPGVSCQGEPQ